MTILKRITPEEVKAAYESTGLRPTMSIWAGISYKTGKKCACALTAVCATNDLSYFDSLRGNMDDAEHIVSSALELPEDYVRGFVGGFDSGHLPTECTAGAMYLLGREDGVAARKAINPYRRMGNDIERAYPIPHHT